MKLVRLGAAVLNQTPLDWDANVAHILEAIEQARQQEVTILCLPELAVTGYGCEDAFHSPALHRTAVELLEERIAPATAGMVVAVGLPLFHRQAVFNAAALCVDGKIEGFVAKRFLAGDGIHYEPRWFKPWPEGFLDEAEVGGRSLPIGDFAFDVGGVGIGFEICEDAWVANRPGGQLALEGADIILNPSASHFAFGKHPIRRRFVSEGSRAFGVAYVYANLLGNESGRIVFDGGALIASGGRIRASGPRLGFRDVVVTSAVVDIDENRMNRARRASHQPDLGATWAEVPFDYPACSPEVERADRPSWESAPEPRMEEFSRAVALGLFDYLRKSRASGFVVSLSGGADSAACATLVWLMVELARAELGEGFGRKLGRDGDPTVKELLTTAYQATRNSSAATRAAARGLADWLGAQHHELDVDALVDGYTRMIEGALGRSLDWERDDIALQNIQARGRAPGVWMLANLQNALLLATSNRSEAAVGYATMDGDTCGGLSPIAGIDKAFLQRWLRFMEEEGHDWPAVKGLGPVNALAPSAELRPEAAGQTDEDDLMPYPLLDAIEGAAIRDKRSPVEVFELMRVAFPDIEPDQLGGWVERFFRLWCRNQWKRERYAPSFHLDDENLDPKTWCRFPILSGGYERELSELRRRVNGR